MISCTVKVQEIYLKKCLSERLETFLDVFTIFVIDFSSRYTQNLKIT